MSKKPTPSAERSSFTRMTLLLTVALLLVAVAITIGLMIFKDGFDRFSYTVSFASMAIWAFVFVVSQLPRRLPPAGDKAMMQQDEAFQSIRWMSLLGGGTLMLLMGASFTAGGLIGRHLPAALNHRQATSFFVIWLMFLVWLVKREGLYDDLTQANRNTATKTGFWAFLLTAVSLFWAGQFRPDWALAGLPALLAMPLAVAMLHFGWLERTNAKEAAE